MEANFTPGRTGLWKGWLRPILGWGLLAIGILGWLLPLVPGWPFVIPGLLILGERYHWARRLVAWAREKAGIRTGNR